MLYFNIYSLLRNYLEFQTEYEAISEMEYSRKPGISAWFGKKKIHMWSSENNFQRTVCL